MGKRLVAQAVAQALNCTAPGPAKAGPYVRSVRLQADPSLQALQAGFPHDACGVCATCTRIARGIHGDVLMVLPGESGAIKIDQAREVIDRTMYRPFEGRRRVTIIDDADAMGAPVQNALLKTLEEPPPSSIFILVTSRPDALLPTVRSRCSQIRFARLASADVAMVLERDHKYAAREALAVAAAADGSVGKALNAKADEFTAARGDAEALLRSTRIRGDARTRVERAKDLIKSGGGSASSERAIIWGCACRRCPRWRAIWACSPAARARTWWRTSIFGTNWMPWRSRSTVSARSGCLPPSIAPRARWIAM